MKKVINKVKGISGYHYQLATEIPSYILKVSSLSGNPQSWENQPS